MKRISDCYAPELENPKSNYITHQHQELISLNLLVYIVCTRKSSRFAVWKHTGLDIFSCSSRIKTRHSYFPALSLHSVSCTTSTNPLLSAICKSASDPIKREHRRYYFIFNARLCTNFKTFRKMYPNFKWLLITSYYPGFPHANTDIWPCMCFTPLTL